MCATVRPPPRSLPETEGGGKDEEEGEEDEGEGEEEEAAAAAARGGGCVHCAESGARRSGTSCRSRPQGISSQGLGGGGALLGSERSGVSPCCLDRRLLAFTSTKVPCLLVQKYAY
jgi:hypothetical protein